MRSSLGTKRLKIDTANAEAALVQRVNATVCPFGGDTEREADTEKPFHPCFCSQNQTWQPHAAGLAAKCTAFGFEEAEPQRRGAPVAGGREGREGLLCLPVMV